MNWIYWVYVVGVIMSILMHLRWIVPAKGDESFIIGAYIGMILISLLSWVAVLLVVRSIEDALVAVVKDDPNLIRNPAIRKKLVEMRQEWNKRKQ